MCGSESAAVAYTESDLSLGRQQHRHLVDRVFLTLAHRRKVLSQAVDLLEAPISVPQKRAVQQKRVREQIHKNINCTTKTLQDRQFRRFGVIVHRCSFCRRAAAGSCVVRMFDSNSIKILSNNCCAECDE